MSEAETAQKPEKRPRGTGCLYRQKNSQCWWIKYSHNGIAYRQSTKETDLRKAERVLQRKLGEIATGNFQGPAVERVRVSELAEDMLREYRVNSRKSLKLTEQRWEKHLKPTFGAMRAAHVGTEALNRYIDKRQSQDAQNGTINRELAALKRMFNLAYRNSPRKVSQVPVFPHLKENAPRKGFVDETQYTLLCQNCKEPWLRSMLAMAYNYGFRKEELLSMRVRQVDLLNRTITLDPGTTKNGEGRIAYMTREVYELLCMSLREKQPNDYVFTRGKQPVRDIRRSWQALCARTGLGRIVCPNCSQSMTSGVKCSGCGAEWKRKRLKYEGLIFHDMRRSAVRNMVRHGVPERVAMAISGHKTRSVFDRYNIVSGADLRDAARRIEEAHTQQSDVGHSFGHSESEANSQTKGQLPL
jgi:integrase